MNKNNKLIILKKNNNKNNNNKTKNIQIQTEIQYNNEIININGIILF